MVAAVIQEVAHIDQSVTQAALVADVAPNLQGFLEIGQRIFVLAQQCLYLRDFVEAERDAGFCPSWRQMASASW